ncbi:MAG: glutaredoxin domain-containing protein [Burkholderiaceae bacterium]
MPKIEIYTKNWCIYCKRAKASLTKLGLSFHEVDVTNNPELEAEMRTRSQQFTVPQIFIGGGHLGGNSDLEAAIRSGRLEQRLSAVPA